MTYLLNHEASLDDYHIDISNGNFYIDNIKLNNLKEKHSYKYCIRFTENIVNLFTDFGIYGVIANAFVSMA